MAKAINRGTCVKPDCLEEAYFKRLCRLHYSQDKGSKPVKDYCFTWNVLDKFEGVVRATSEKEALRLVASGVAAGSRIVIGPKPCNIELVDIREC